MDLTPDPCSRESPKCLPLRKDRSSVNLFPCPDPHPSVTAAAWELEALGTYITLPQWPVRCTLLNFRSVNHLSVEELIKSIMVSLLNSCPLLLGDWLKEGFGHI